MPGAKDPNQKVNEFTLAFLIKRAAPIEAEAIGVAGKPGAPGKAPAAPAKPAVPAEAKKS